MHMLLRVLAALLALAVTTASAARANDPRGGRQS